MLFRASKRRRSYIIGEVGWPPLQITPFVPSRLYTHSRDSQHKFSRDLVTYCYILVEFFYSSSACNRNRPSWRQKLLRVMKRLQKSPPIYQRQDGTGGPGFFSMFLMENKSPRFFALWFAIIIASTGTLVSRTLTILLNVFKNRSTQKRSLEFFAGEDFGHDFPNESKASFLLPLLFLFV